MGAEEPLTDMDSGSRSRRACSCATGYRWDCLFYFIFFFLGTIIIAALPDQQQKEKKKNPKAVLSHPTTKSRRQLRHRLLRDGDKPRRRDIIRDILIIRRKKVTM